MYVYIQSTFYSFFVTVQSDHVLFGYSKLSLFFDWLAYQLDSDNIMNIGEIQPLILVYACVCVD